MGIIGTTKRRILEAVKKRSSHGYELADRLGISLSSAYDHLNELHENGFVEFKMKGRRKVYELTENGEKLLESIG